MEKYKIDRKTVSNATFKEADDHVNYYTQKTPVEILNHACDIINPIFDSNPNDKIDRTIFSFRKHAKSI